MISKWFFIGLTLFWTGHAIAGQEIGNGGDALLCNDNGTETIEILDFFEARTTLGIQIDLGDANIMPIEKARIAFERLATYDQERSAKYLDHLAKFCEETLILPESITLPDVNDTGYLELPRNCEIKQVALQKEPQSSLHRRYRISGEHWPLSDLCDQISPRTSSVQLDNDSMAGFIIHEIVYRDAIERGHADSKATRLMTGLVSSDLTNVISEEDYHKETFKQGFTSFEFLAWRGTHEKRLHLFVKPTSRDEAILNCGRFADNSYLLNELQVGHIFNNEFFDSAISRQLRALGQTKLWIGNNRKLLNLDVATQSKEVADAFNEQELPYLCISFRDRR